ncbi:MAG: aspartate aminotransferase family protein [Dehalococcoidia bacterium]
MADWQKLEKKYLMGTFKRLPVTIVKGKGARVWDEDGNEYLDFLGGLAVDVLGHSHPVVVNAVAKQARELIQTSNLVYTVPQVKLAKLMVENSCLDKVFFCNSGSEACEGAVKLARRYGKLHRKGAWEVITATKSFHGRTLAMTAATGQHKFQEPYVPLPDGFVNVLYDSIDAIKKATTDKTCAIMMEPIQGEGGVNVPADDYLKKVRSWCDKKGILLILDEIQTGIGRAGSLFAYEQYGVEPDIITLAKGLGGGVAIGAFMAKDEVSVFEPGEHGSTFGGNPLACAAGYATISYMLKNGVIDNCHTVGDYLAKSISGLKKKSPLVVGVRGRGLLLAMELSRDVSSDLVMECLKEGLILNPVLPNAVRFVPPLIITKDDVDEAMEIVKKVLARMGKK